MVAVLFCKNYGRNKFYDFYISVDFLDKYHHNLLPTLRVLHENS